MIELIIEGCIYFIFNILIAIFGFYTGELVLYCITFGKRKIRWNYYKDNTNTNLFIIFIEISIWIGIIFWMLCIMLMSKL